MLGPVTTTSFELNSLGMYWGDHFIRRLNFPGIAVPQVLKLKGTGRIDTTGPFPCRRSDFGWYVVDDSLQYLYKRSLSCGIANSGMAGGTFLKSGANGLCRKCGDVWDRSEIQCGDRDRQQYVDSNQGYQAQAAQRSSFESDEGERKCSWNPILRY